MNPEIKVQTPDTRTPQSPKPKNLFHLKIFGVLLTLAGICLFAYFVYSVGLDLILEGVRRIGWAGFGLILFIYFCRICLRATSWRLSVYEPYKLNFSDTLPAVIIGEALSSLIPLGILISGTSKAVAVRKRVPLVVGLSSIATENLFYSLVTGLFVALGAFTFLRNFELPDVWVLTIDFLIFGVLLLILFGLLMVIRQWHWASAICDRLYDKGYFRGILENGRLHVRLFENLIYGFYRKHPRRFLPIFSFQVLYHLLGVFEVLFILSRILDTAPGFYASFLLESVSRIITIVFKLIPFLIGVDEAGAQFVSETLALGAGIGVTLAIVRKGRILFWTAIGVSLIVKRGLSLREIMQQGKMEEK